MGKSVIDKNTLLGIANAIREQEGSSEPIKVENFAERIMSLVGGGEIKGIEVQEFQVDSNTSNVTLYHSLPHADAVWVMSTRYLDGTYKEVDCLGDGVRRIVALGNGIVVNNGVMYTHPSNVGIATYSSNYGVNYYDENINIITNSTTFRTDAVYLAYIFNSQEFWGQFSKVRTKLWQ